MAEQEFELVFDGEILPGVEAPAVKKRLAALFKIDVAKTARLFSGAAHTVKKSVDAATAERYRQAFEKAGAVLRVNPVITFSADTLSLVEEKEIKFSSDGRYLCGDCGTVQAPGMRCRGCGVLIDEEVREAYLKRAKPEYRGPERRRLERRDGRDRRDAMRLQDDRRSGVDRRRVANAWNTWGG